MGALITSFPSWWQTANVHSQSRWKFAFCMARLFSCQLFFIVCCHLPFHISLPTTPPTPHTFYLFFFVMRTWSYTSLFWTVDEFNHLNYTVRITLINNNFICTMLFCTQPSNFDSPPHPVHYLFPPHTSMSVRKLFPLTEKEISHTQTSLSMLFTAINPSPFLFLSLYSLLWLMMIH